jgi:hypothetical protein
MSNTNHILQSAASIGNKISADETGNSTKVLLGSSETFTGAWEDATQYTTAATAIIGTNAAATGTLYMDLSQDGGTTFTSIPFVIPDITFDIPHVITLAEQWIRIRYVNDATAQTGTFQLQTRYSNGGPLGVSNKMGDLINARTEGQIVKSVVTGADPNGDYVNLAADGYVDAATTTSNLGIAGVFDSGVIDINGHTQIVTELISDQDGTLVGTWYSDSGGTDAIRTFTRPYKATEGYVYFSAPTFAPYLRYVYTNGAVAQTDFRLGFKLVTKAISGQILGLRDFVPQDVVANLTRVTNSADFDRNLGLLGGQQAKIKFGYNASVSTSFEDIWEGADLGGATTYTFPQAAETLRVKAGGDVNDTSAGTGAQTVRVDFLDSNWDEVSEVLTLAGASASAATSATAFRVLRVEVVDVGTYGGSNTGDIVIENTTTNTELAYVGAGLGIAQQSIYTVPAGKTAYITKLEVSVGQGNSADVRLFKIEKVDDVTTPFGAKVFQWGVEDFSGATEFVLQTFLKFDEKTDLIMDAQRITGSGTARVSSSFEFILIDN